ncbi:hypothetical protein CROQUDRAFT_652916 [Cronartium quercuum f. sp. fusiforme G11]|uniref:ferric-chelate reductase (NADPH) n=1 Tax=Cronartium quercuum f. sp. fusiforme G11 TaxID=708437 RepID=A0A9P6NMM9_9BASI|nr:hypothetical protein CROQUDRAFT_652916 [Cronartium quercuum f. sp. fusiforme G11]
MTTAQLATVAYVPPHATAAPSTFTGSPTQVNFGTSTDQPGNTNIYLYYFIVPYLDAHVLSPPSWRYAYIFWIVLSVFLVIWTVLHQLNKYATSVSHHPFRRQTSSTTHHTFITTRLLRSLSIRRLAPGSTSNKPTRWYASTLLTFGQLITLLAFTGILLAVSLVGDDYISPTTCTWGGTCPVQVFNQGPPKSSYAPLRIRRRNAPTSPPPPQSAERSWVDNPHEAQSPLQVRSLHKDPHRLVARASALSLNPGGWAPFNDPLLAAPNYDVPRNMWTLSSRFGLIAYAMLPLIVTLGLKSWPFNVFAMPWLTNYGFDKSATVHRWFGRLVWIWSTIHTATFTVQLTWDYNPYGRMLITDVWQYYRFNWGVVAYIALTFIVGLSFNPFRDRYYELFYCSHVILSILCLVGCIIHYEPLWAWSVIALGLWGAERAVRLIRWFYINGLFSAHIGPTRFWCARPTEVVAQHSPTTTLRPTEHVSLFAYGFGPLEPTPAPYSLSYQPISSQTLHAPAPNTADFGLNPVGPCPKPSTHHIPPGFALAQLLPGETVRLRLRLVQGRTSWSAGQYVLVCLPSVSWWQTHPYTIANSCLLSEEEMVLIVRARGGLTRGLYNQLAVGDGKPVLVRCMISQPLGSSSRIGWSGFESVVVICGGSGISFGTGLLEELVAGLAGGQTRVRRIRFVWILRDHAHLTWVAPALKRCLLMVGPEQVRVDLFVSSRGGETRQKKPASQLERLEKGFAKEEEDGSYLLNPPHAPFTLHHEMSSQSSSELTMTQTEREFATPSPSLPELRAAGGGEDLTEFEGERQVRSEMDEMISTTVKVEGKRRRRATLSRRANKQHGSESDSFSPPVLPSPPTHRRENSRQSLLGGGRGGEDLRFELEESERVDLEDLSEIVRTGRPELGEILGVELSRSTGRTVVACCGPSRLSGIVRGLVADRVREGKQVDIWTEDFSY